MSCELCTFWFCWRCWLEFQAAKNQLVPWLFQKVGIYTILSASHLSTWNSDIGPPHYLPFERCGVDVAWFDMPVASHVRNHVDEQVSDEFFYFYTIKIINKQDEEWAIKKRFRLPYGLTCSQENWSITSEYIEL